MPIYEFRCTGCGRRFETLCAVGDSGSGLSCPNCGAKSSERVMSSFCAAGTSGGKGTGPACFTCSARNCGSCGH